MAPKKKGPTLTERVEKLEARMDQMKKGLQEVLNMMENLVNK